MNQRTGVFLCLVIFALTGCTQALTESSAVNVVQRYVDEQNGGVVSTSIATLTSQFGREHSQPLQQPGIQRLVKEGWLEQKTVTVSYPNFGGEFTGQHTEHLGMTQSTWTDTLSIQIGAENPPSVRGSFRSCYPAETCISGTLQGVVQKDGYTRVKMIPNEETSLQYYRRWNWSPWNFVDSRPLDLSPEREPNRLLGRWGDEYVSFQAVRGRGPDIGLNSYVYGWTDKLPKDVVLNGSVLKLGHLVVDSCAQLLLDSETAAKAVCRTHVELTKAQVIFGGAPTDQLIQAVFGKQPNGNWVTTRVSYSPPQYVINQ